jgi:hypothetical protein
MQCGQSVQLLNVKFVGASRDQYALFKDPDRTAL